LVAQEFVADAVHLERVLVAVALGVHIEMQVVAGELAVEQLDATDLDDAVAVVGREARGFRVEDDLAHQWFSFAWLIEYFGISTVTSFCARMAWHDRRELGSRPQARSSRSSSVSS